MADYRDHEPSVTPKHCGEARAHGAHRWHQMRAGMRLCTGNVGVALPDMLAPIIAGELYRLDWSREPYDGLPEGELTDWYERRGQEVLERIRSRVAS